MGFFITSDVLKLNSDLIIFSHV